MSSTCSMDLQQSGVLVAGAGGEQGVNDGIELSIQDVVEREADETGPFIDRYSRHHDPLLPHAVRLRNPDPQIVCNSHVGLREAHEKIPVVGMDRAGEGTGLAKNPTLRALRDRIVLRLDDRKLLVFEQSLIPCGYARTVARGDVAKGVGVTAPSRRIRIALGG